VRYKYKAKPELMHPAFIPEDDAERLEALKQFIQIYADPGNWRRSTGHPPHNLREGVHLDFHPLKVCDGWNFAEEALDFINRHFKPQPKKLTWWQLILRILTVGGRIR